MTTAIPSNCPAKIIDPPIREEFTVFVRFRQNPPPLAIEEPETN
jgi:hypothetical protein